MADMKAPMVVRRRFQGPGDGPTGLRWYKSGEVVETVEWRNAPSLERLGYLRPLAYQEEIAEGDGGKFTIADRGPGRLAGGTTRSAEAQVAEGERASSTQGSDSESSASTSAEEEVEIEIDHLGGGWYNVTVDGKLKTQSPIQGKDAAQEFAEQYR